MDASTRVELKRVLCPIDFSDSSEHALRHAAAVARWHRSELRILFVHAIAPTVEVLPPLAGPPPVFALTPADRARILDHMRQFASRAVGGGAFDVVVQDAPNVPREILAQASVWGADLLVVGSHGRSGFERFLLGSVTEKIVRLAPCPVLVVPHSVEVAPTTGDVEFDRILCAVDFSDSSREALAYAMSMAEETGAQLTVLNAIEVPPELNETPASADFSVEAVRARAEAQQQARLAELVPDSVRTYCTVETAVVEGKASREILRQATAKKSDLIVMGVQGRSAMNLAIFGSNAQQVITNATCPVLIVRAPL